MPKWGSTDFEELKKLELQIRRAANADFDAFCVEMSKELAARFLAKVKKRTLPGKKPKFDKPLTYTKTVNGRKRKFRTKEGEIRNKYWKGYTGGTLSRGWTIGNITQKPNGYEIEIINPTEYASYVEFGHRQKPGRFVPQIGKALKKSWAPGKFMMTITEQEIQNMAPALIQKRFEKFLRQVMSGDQ